MRLFLLRLLPVLLLWRALAASAMTLALPVAGAPLNTATAVPHAATEFIAALAQPSSDKAEIAQQEKAANGHCQQHSGDENRDAAPCDACQLCHMTPLTPAALAPVARAAPGQNPLLTGVAFVSAALAPIVKPPIS